MIPISVQLYTVRDLTAKDFAGTVKQVADIGYQTSRWPVMAISRPRPKRRRRSTTRA